MTKLILKTTLNIFIIMALFYPYTSFGLEKKPKKPTVPVKAQEAVTTDANITTYVKKGDELLKKGDLDSSLKIYQKANGYAKDVLVTTKLLRAQYEKIITDPSTEQNDREEIILKQKRMKQIVPKYNSIKESTSYGLGYIFAKKGDSERARKYLLEVLETVPFSLKTDSLWMKTKTLLLSQYGLEGEF